MRDGLGLTRREFAAVATGGLGAIVVPQRASAAPRFPVGVFVSSPDETVELRAYADRKGFGRLTLVEGLLADIPVVPRVPVLVCNLPQWWLQTIWLTSQRILRDELAERRAIAYTTRRYAIDTFAAIPSGLDTDARIAKLLDAVGASDANPGYVVASLSNGAVVRDYLVELRPDR